METSHPFPAQVEVNTRRGDPRTMPQAIPPVVAAATRAGFESVAAVAAALADGTADARLAAAGDWWDDDARRALRQVPLHRVFVYGSLRRGLFNDHYMASSSPLGAARTADALALVTNGRVADAPYTWPYAIAPRDARAGAALAKVDGELYCCSTEALEACDDLEEHPHHYRRRRVALDGEAAEAWMYVLVSEVELAAARADAAAYADVGSDWAAFVRALP